jgi:hypothetical protein
MYPDYQYINDPHNSVDKSYSVNANFITIVHMHFAS